MPAAIHAVPITRAPCVQRDHADPDRDGEDRAEDRRERHPRAADRDREGHAEGARAVGLAEAQRDHGQVGERERDHRPVGEQAGEELHVVRQGQREGDHRRDRDRHVRRAAAPVQAPDRARYLAVGGERVGEPRQAEHLPVHRGEQHRRRGGAHEVARDVEQDARLVGVDDRQHGRLDEAVAEGRAVAHHGRRHQAGDRHAQEQQHRRGDRGEHHPPQAAAAHADLARKARRGLHADHRHGRDAGGEDHVLPAAATPRGRSRR